MADRIRDRTLVLRVTSPSLQARLREKMAEAEAEGSTGAKSGSGPDTPTRSAKEGQLKDLEGVTLNPSEDGSTLFSFHCDGKEYPARLVNLPCPVEVHKTHDHAMFYKCSDVGQIIIVYEDEACMAEAENTSKYRSDGFPSYYHSGLTPPMKRVVERRFAAREHASVAPPREEVADVEKELKSLIASINKDTYKSRSKSAAPPPSSSGDDTKIIEEVVEEVVDYEPWMDDNGRQPNGIKFDWKDQICMMHPELWLPPVPREEKEKQKKAKEQQEAEQKKAAAATAAPKPKPKAKAKEKTGSSDGVKEKKEKSTKTKKKKGKKDKNKEKDVQLNMDGQPVKTKKGIASKKNRELDPVMLSAVQMATGGDAGEDAELLFDDNFFDFGEGDDFSGGEDISGLDLS